MPAPRRLALAALTLIVVGAAAAYFFNQYWIHRFDALIARQAAVYRLDPDLVWSVIYEETYFRPSGASGRPRPACASWPSRCGATPSGRSQTPSATCKSAAGTWKKSGRTTTTLPTPSRASSPHTTPAPPAPPSGTASRPAAAPSPPTSSSRA